MVDATTSIKIGSVVSYFVVACNLFPEVKIENSYCTRVNVFTLCGGYQQNNTTCRQKQQEQQQQEGVNIKAINESIQYANSEWTMCTYHNCHVLSGVHVILWC